jgi:hypothetical protein
MAESANNEQVKYKAVSTDEIGHFFNRNNRAVSDKVII